MKYWWIIDEAVTVRSAVWTEKLNAATQDDAIDLARMEWDRLTDAEKNKRDAFYVCYAPEAANGGPDLDEATDFRSIKEEQT